MSLSLLQSYSSSSSSEEEARSTDDNLSDSEENDEEIDRKPSTHEKEPLFDHIKSTGGSILPSAFDAFSEISGPPEFLNNCVDERVSDRDLDQRERHGGRNRRKEKRDLPVGVVVEAKAQLVGIRERVRSDVEGNHAPPSMPTQKGPTGEGKRVASATIPEPKDAAELLRMCLQCGIPKTYSEARGMVCPVCGDRPIDPNKESEKKKGSTMKDKEKSKRMKGQSSHATWKSETEMQLRQQFD